VSVWRSEPTGTLDRTHFRVTASTIMHKVMKADLSFYALAQALNRY
jgi:hypothetical protein